MSLPRYPRYKKVDARGFGEIPDHWEVASFKRLVEIQNGADHKTVQVDDGYPVYGSGGVFAFASEYLFDGESVLLGRKGTVDRPLYVTGKFWTVDTMYWTKISPDACGKFCYYAAMSIPFSYYSTSTALPSMTQSVLGAHPMAFPKKEEQVAIAEFLDYETAKIDALIAEQEKLIALLTEKRQATISHAVTRGINPDARLKESGVPWLGQVPAHWEVIRLGQLFREVTEPGEEGHPVLSVSIHNGVSDKELDDSEVDRKVSRSEDKSKYKAVRPGDLSYNMMRAWQGGFGAVTVCGMVSPAYVVARPKADLLTSHIEKLLRTPLAVAEMKRYSKGVTDFRLRLYWEEFKAIHVSLPPRPEQENIAQYVDSEVARLDALVGEAQRGIALLKERRSALITAAVNGQIDVRGLVTEVAT